MSLSKEPQEDQLEAARRVAIAVVTTFIGDAKHIGIDDAEDLVEILVEHWRHQDAFRRDGPASRDTYMRTVFHHKLLELNAAARAAKRGAGSLPLSLEEPLDGESDTTLAETVMDKSVEADVELVAANDELRRALADLRPYLAQEDRELLGALWLDPRVRPASRMLGIHHSTGYARLARIRAVAEERGLGRYL